MAVLCMNFRNNLGGVFERNLRIRCVYKLVSATTSTTRRSQSALPPEVVIPNYIPRGPTDILRALASTVHKDPTAHHYIYHDDPFFLPSNNFNKRSFILSKESGKRAARYFLENFPQNFENDDAEPRIPAFNPPIKLTDISEVSTDMLSDLIHSSQVLNAYQAYKNLKASCVTVSQEMQCELLELLCFNNSMEPNDETYRDEKWFDMNQSGRHANSVWQKNGLAEQLYEEMEVKDARAYHALIQGLSRYGHRDAFKLYSEMKEQGLEGSTKMYNGLIRFMAFESGNVQSRWTTVMEFLQAMVQEDLEPDLGTFNSLLLVLTRLRGLSGNTDIAKSILAEMKALGIEPSLATYSHVIHLYCYTNKDSNSSILRDIMNLVENKAWDLRDPDDMMFFPLAMDVCNSHLQDIALAHRVHAMLCRHSHEKFFQDAERYNRYYSNYFRMLCVYEEPEKFFALYTAVVPTVYVPEPKVMEEIVESVNVHGNLTFLPRLWSDVRMFLMENRPVLLETVLSIVAKGLAYQNDTTLQQQLMTVAWDVFQCVEERNQRVQTRVKVTWTGDMVGDLLTCCLIAGDTEKSWEVINFILKMKDNIVGNPPAETLLKYCKVELDTGSKEKALACLRYACSLGMPETLAFMTENAENLPKEFLDRYLELPVN